MADRQLAKLKVDVAVNAAQLDALPAKARRVGSSLQSGVGGGAKKADKALEESMHHSATLLGETGGHVDGLSKKLGALQGLMGAGMGTAIAGGLGAAALGIAVEAGQSAIQISEANEVANASLEQAAGTSTQSLAALKNVRDDFVAGNTKFIDSQSEVTEGFATFTREGLTTTQTARDMNIALDLSKLKHISLTDAVHMVAGAEQGRMKPLIDLGINTKSLNAANVEADKSMQALTRAQGAAATAHDNVTQAERRLQEMHDSLKGKTHLTAIETDHLQDAQKAVKDATDKANAADADLATAKGNAKAKIDVVNTAMDELRDKTDKGRDTTSKMDQAQHDLNNKWQKTAQDIGPPLMDFLTQATQDLDDFYGGLTAFGKDDSAWKWINDITVDVVKLATPLEGLVETIHLVHDAIGNATSSNVGAGSQRGRTPGRAAGGPVVAGERYLVGEQGPEIMVPESSGSIIPARQTAAALRSGDTYHFHQVMANPAAIAAELAWRAKVRTS